MLLLFLDRRIKAFVLGLGFLLFLSEALFVSRQAFFFIPFYQSMAVWSCFKTPFYPVLKSFLL